MPARRFPLPWSIDELEVCFVVRDDSGQQLAYVYFGDRRARGRSLVSPGPVLHQNRDTDPNTAGPHAPIRWACCISVIVMFFPPVTIATLPENVSAEST